MNLGTRAQVMKIFFLVSAVIISVMLVSCGQKKPPSLKTFAKPAPVGNITAVHRENSILLSWSYSDTSDFVKAFYLEKAEGSAVTFRRIAFLPDTTRHYVDTDFVIGGTYFYRITVLSLRNVLSKPSQVLRVDPAVLPPPPSGLYYELTNDSVKVRWNGVPERTEMTMYSTLPRSEHRLNLESGAELRKKFWLLTGVKSISIKVKYNIYKSNEKKSFPESPLNRAALNDPAFNDGVETRMPTYYVVRSFLDRPLKDEGVPSEALEVNPETFVPSRPSGLKYVHAPNGLALIWNENPETWVKSYRVYRKKAGESSFRAIGEAITPTFRDADPLTSRTEYYVTAVGPLRESAPLEPVEVNPLPAAEGG
ncbi:MAG: hypothetical protein HQL09_03230 [Nitrospirae bacterium]|nr:hypothetical protein [Nitrospirota bacterium]